VSTEQAHPDGDDRLQLLLVPARPSRQVLPVLLRHGQHHRRPIVDTGNMEPALRALYAWGPDVPPFMLEPDDLADLMAVSHQG